MADKIKERPSGDEQRPIAIVGASGSGKSTLWRALRHRLSSEAWAHFPLRFVSRPPRGDDVEENLWLEFDAFPPAQERGDIAFYWEKVLQDGRGERYGFPATSQGATVYGCNSAFVTNVESVQPEQDWSRWTIIHIACPAHERLARLSARPGFVELSAAEQATRQADDDEILRARSTLTIFNRDGELSSALSLIEQQIRRLGRSGFCSQ